VPFAAALSTHPDAATATAEVTGQVVDRLGGSPDLAVVFLSGTHVEAADEIAATIGALLDPRAFIGSSACGVLGGPHGVEEIAAVSLWAGRMEGDTTPFHLTAVEDGDSWRLDGLPAISADDLTMILLPDPFTFPLSDFVRTLRRDHPNVAVIGGVASAAARAGGNRLVVGGRVVRHGAVGVLLPAVSTRADHNVLQELAGRPALERLIELLEALPPAERALASQGIHCGVVADEHKLDFGRGDFLIRGLLGVDRDEGSITVGEIVPVGATVQFQVRDASTAGEDLRLLLGPQEHDGALVFTCNGRGAAMFGTADHDARIVCDQIGSEAIAGMFSAGEIGPVAGRNAIHGFTASVALFSD